MVGLFAEKKVVEFTLDGKEVWSVDAPSAWSAIRLHNGNTLISGDGMSYTREVNMKGETVWELTQADVPFKLYNNQTATRLANGNTVITNWCAGNINTEEWAGTVQVFEVTTEGGMGIVVMEKSRFGSEYIHPIVGSAGQSG